MKIGQNRNCKCGTFRRICTGSKFIKENQRTFIYFLKERDNIGHMRRECTKALLNTLFISDICINLMKYSQFTAVSGRNVKSGLSHQTEQADRFQRNSFTAGIWSGDDQQCEVLPKCHGDRNNFFRIEQWVTSLTDTDASLFIQKRPAGAHGHCQSTSCKNEVKIRQRTVIHTDFLDILCGFFT